ncbi:MAG: type II toxin-antitoxin system MqsA family antitoxin [Candidatus Accumulibacter meliphilus]|uniref:type II toxin-antitoxin system MqsA family antitoxin n=1 Tax=Candidatus Accumulibacter meliphilus TaxID=2211374 RepID=UPI002FC3CE77
MKCPICRHGETRPGAVTVPLERGDVVIVFRDVPALVCENCDEAFHDEAFTAALLKQAEQTAAAGVEIDVRRFAVAVLGCHYRGIGGQRPGLGEGSAGDRRDWPIGRARHAANPRKTGEC